MICLFLIPMFSYADESFQYLCKRTDKDFVQLYELNPSDKTITFIYAYNQEAKKKYNVNEHTNANAWIDNIVTLFKHRPAAKFPSTGPLEGEYPLDDTTLKTFYLDHNRLVISSHTSYQSPSSSVWNCKVVY